MPTMSHARAGRGGLAQQGTTSVRSREMRCRDSYGLNDPVVTRRQSSKRFEHFVGTGPLVISHENQHPLMPADRIVFPQSSLSSRMAIFAPVVCSLTAIFSSNNLAISA